MSLKAKVKQEILKCLIHKCDRDYDRTYQYTKKYLSYDRLITCLEQQREDVPDVSLDLDIKKQIKITPFAYAWEQDVDVAGLLEKAKNSDYLVLCEETAFLHVNAVEEIETYLREHPETLVLYGDEDVIDENGVRKMPWLKPAWSPTLFLQQHYVGGLLVAKSGLILQVLRAGLSLKNMRYFAYELCLAAGGFGLRSQAIAHLDRVLLHQPRVSSFERYLNCDKLMDPAIGGIALDAIPEGIFKVSIVIPSKDQAAILTRNLRALEKTVPDSSLEVIIVDNGSTEQNKEKVEKLIQELTFDTKYIYEPMDFNFSAMCNLGAKESSGKYLLFLNDDIEALSGGWLEKMVSEACKGRVGCVGAKLLYPGTNKIQHAGVMELTNGPIHKLQYQADDTAHYFNWNKTDRECLAVTGACLLIEKALFDEVGGFDEELSVTFNDIDLCYKLYAKGYYNVCLNSISLYHHESLSRGVDEATDKKRRLIKEREKLYGRHAGLKNADPFYHRCLGRQQGDMRIVPALEESLDTLPKQLVCKPWTEKDWKDLRRHEGVRMSLEEGITEGVVKGYLLMLGDNNACYEKRLLLADVASGDTYSCVLNNTLREDVQLGMPDQVKIALSGFEGKLVGLPKGEYEIKAVAHNKISRVSYWRETGYTVSITEENHGL